MDILLIRHGMTAGNREKRYIGRTDEALCGEGIAQLRKASASGIYPKAELVYCSPMKRCLQTAEILYPNHRPQQIDDFRECDFGWFEGKNYMELAGNPCYQEWIDSNGTLPFPEGEDVAAFKRRSVYAFAAVLQKLAEEKSNRELQEGTAAMIVHGGTIMSILEAYCGGGYYDYHCKNGSGYVCRCQPEEKSLILEHQITVSV